MNKGRIRVLLLTGLLVVTAIGSAASVTATRVGNEGCTLGFWSQNTGAWAGSDFAPGDLLGDVFDLTAYPTLADDTLLQALSYNGGPALVDKVKLLLKQSVAAILSASHDGVGYPYGTADVIDWVNNAIASGDADEVGDLKDDLDAANNLGCSLSADESNK